MSLTFKGEPSVAYVYQPGRISFSFNDLLFLFLCVYVKELTDIMSYRHARRHQIP